VVNISGIVNGAFKCGVWHVEADAWSRTFLAVQMDDMKAFGQIGATQQGDGQK
jgi:hypothetical protein